jgi:hypothetical protein
MNPFGSAIYIFIAIFALAAVLIGYGTYSDVPLAILIGAVLGVGVVAFVLYGLSKARYT